MNAYDLQEVMAHKDDWCATLVLNTAKGPLGRDKSKLEYKKLVRQLQQGIKGQDQQAFILRPLNDLLNNQIFWQNLRQSVVIYRSTKLFKALTLPYPLPTTVIQDKRFMTKFLMPMMHDVYPYNLLIITNNSVKLYHSDGETLDAEKVPNLPQKISDVAELSEGYRQRTHTPSSPHGINTGFSSFYTGIGEDEGEAYEDLKRFFKAIDKALITHLKGRKETNVVMGVESMLHHYLKHSELPHLLQTPLKGTSSDDLKAIHQSVLELLHAEQPNTSEQLRRWASEHQGKAPERILTKPEEILKAAREDRIDTLFLWFEEPLVGDDWQEEAARQVSAHKGHVAQWHQSCAILYY